MQISADSPKPEEILYGDHSASAARGPSPWMPEVVSLRALHLTNDGYFNNFEGFSGCSEWMVKVDTLPPEWLQQSHYSPQNQRSAELLLQRMQIKAKPPLLNQSFSCWLRADESDSDSVIVESKDQTLTASAHQLTAVQSLSATAGEWRLWAQGGKQILVYVAEDHTLLGLVGL